MPVRREIALIAAVSALALAPLLFLGLKSAFGPRAVTIVNAIPTPAPLLAALKSGSNGYFNSKAWLSPDGRWIARMEYASVPTAGATPAPRSQSIDELVIRSAVGGREVFRDSLSGRFVGWIPRSSSFIAQDGFDLSIFSPTPRKPGAPPPAALWSATVLSFPTDGDPVADQYGSPGLSKNLERSPINISPDGRYAVKSSWSKGDIYWRVADLSTGKIAAPIKAGRWLSYDPNVGGAANGISASIAPANSSRAGALPLVAVLQEDIIAALAQATPTPRPTPIPTATPTPSPAQTEFLTRSQAYENETQVLVEKVLGIDGAPPEVSDEAEIARIEAEVKRRTRTIDAERERLFPAPSPTPAPPRKIPKVEDAKPFRIECFDLNTGKKLWSQPVYAFPFQPQAQFSPDGASLVAWNTTRLINDRNRNPNPSLDDTGIDFFDPISGKKRAAFRLYEEDFSIPNPEQAIFTGQIAPNGSLRSFVAFPDSHMVRETVPDARSLGRTVRQFRKVPTLRFFDTTLAREAGHIDIDTTRLGNIELKNFTASDAGDLWLFGRSDFTMAPRSQLGSEFASPLPKPTPSPTRNPTPAPRKF